MPNDPTGVPVTLYVLDSNDNDRTIGTTSTGANGVYGFVWKPDMTGNYTVNATFPGTQSYYGSSTPQLLPGAPWQHRTDIDTTYWLSLK